MGISYFIGNSLVNLTYIFFATLTLHPKRNRILAFFLIAVPNLLCFSFWFVDEVTYRFVYSYGPLLVYLLGILICFSDPLKEKIVYFSISFGIFLTLSLLGDTLFSVLNLTIYDNILILIFLIVFCFIYGTVMSIFSRFFQRKIKTEMFRKNLWAFLAFPFTQLFLFFTISAIIGHAGLFGTYQTTPLVPDENVLKALVIISVVLCIITDVFFLFIMIKNANHNKLQEELRFQQSKNELQLEYYQSLEKNSENIRKIRHDFINILQTVTGLHSNKDTYSKEQATRLFKDLQDTVAKLDVTSYTQNRLVDTIVNNKLKDCPDDIILSVIINLPEYAGVKDIDLCRAFTNLLDNAITAVMKAQGNRFLSIESYIDAGFLYIKTYNSKPERSLSVNDPVSSGDGYGKLILNDLANNYDGAYFIEEDENTFTALLTLALTSI